MLTLFTGTDRLKALNAFNEASSLATLTFNPDDFEVGEFTATLTKQSLFGEGVSVAARDLNTLVLARETVEDLAAELDSSPNHFIFLETGDKNSLANTLAEVKGVKVNKFDLKEGKARTFNPFAMTDALIARDRKQLWLTFQMARREGLSVEEIYPPLSWQAKNMLLVAVSKPEDKLDLKPFVITKAKQALRNYSPIELKKLFANLIELHHTTYPNSDEFEFGLEKLILTI